MAKPDSSLSSQSRKPTGKKKPTGSRGPRAYKFEPDTGDAPALARPHLAERLPDGGARHVLLLQAPAGFGKTYALSQWAEMAATRGAKTVWINLQPEDRSPDAFLTTLFAGIVSADISEEGGLSAKVFAGRADLAEACEILVSAIEGYGGEAFWVIEGYHHAKSDANSQFMELLFERMPRNLTLAVSSRKSIGVPVSRLLLQGRLSRVGKEELAFTKEEIRDFFRNELSPTHFKNIREVTQGWPAAVRLVEVCLEQWRKAKGPLEALPVFSELVSDFITTEVLSDLADEEARDFLAESSLFEVIDPGLIDAIRGRQDSAALLSRLTEQETFFHVTDVTVGQWRLPYLMRQVVLKKLVKQTEADMAERHLAAAAWFEHHADLTTAISHYLKAGAMQEAVAAVERCNPLHMAINQGDELANRVIRMLPSEGVRQSPRLVLARIYLDYKRGLIEEARYQFEELSRSTQEFTQDRRGGDDRQLQLEATTIEIFMELYISPSISADRLAQLTQKVAEAPKASTYLTTLMQMVLAVQTLTRGDVDLAEHTFGQAEKLNAQDYSAWEALWLKHHHGTVALARGKLHEARHLFQKGLRQSRVEFHQNRSFPALTYLLLAEIDYEFGSLSEARAKVDEGIYMAEHVEAWLEHYTSAYETLAMLTYHAEGVDGVEALLVKLDGITRVRRLLKNFVPALRMKAGLLGGDHQLARETQERFELRRRWMDENSHDDFGWREWDMIGLALARLAIEDEDFDVAQLIIDRLERDIRLAGRMRSYVRMQLVYACLKQRQGDGNSALRYLAEALETGHAQGYVRTFLEDIAELRPLLSDLTTRARAEFTSSAISLAEKLLQMDERSGAEVGQAVPDLLSVREREVLQELSLGHSSKLIARKLSLSEPTIKFHIQNLFRKLDVRKRTAAVAEAHRRGLLK